MELPGSVFWVGSLLRSLVTNLGICPEVLLEIGVGTTQRDHLISGCVMSRYMVRLSVPSVYSMGVAGDIPVT